MKPIKLKTSPVILVSVVLFILLSIVYYFNFRSTGLFSDYSLIVLILSSLCLLWKHKLAWFISIFLSFIFMLLMIVHVWMNGYLINTNENYILLQYIISFYSLYIITLVLYHYRFPYIDLRQKFFGPTPFRYDLDLDVLMKYQGKEYSGKTMNISYNGVKVKFNNNAPLKFSDEGFEPVYITIKDAILVELKSQVVFVDKNEVVFTFKELNFSQELQFRNWILSLVKNP